MLLVYQLWASLSASIALASAAASSIEGTNDLMLALAPASNVSYPTSASEQVNITFEPFNVDGSNDPKIACNGAQFGRGLTYGACLDAISTFQTPITGNVSIGPRDHRQRYDYHLPWRWISGDGRCAFDVVKMNTYAFALATAEELRTAATSLADACVRDRGGKGGIVTNVGVGGSLAIQMRTYDPSRITCNDTIADPPYQDECELLLQNMPASSSPTQTFGPPGGRGVTEGLPYTFAAPPPHGCVLQLGIVGLPATTLDRSTWFDIWASVVAMRGMCARFNRDSRMVIVGDYGKMTMWLMSFDYMESGPSLVVNQTRAIVSRSEILSQE